MVGGRHAPLSVMQLSEQHLRPEQVQMLERSTRPETQWKSDAPLFLPCQSGVVHYECRHVSSSSQMRSGDGGYYTQPRRNSKTDQQLRRAASAYRLPPHRMLPLQRSSLALACGQLVLRLLDRRSQRSSLDPKLLCHVRISLTVLAQRSELLHCCRAVCVRVICFLPADHEIMLDRFEVGDSRSELRAQLLCSLLTSQHIPCRGVEFPCCFSQLGLPLFCLQLTRHESLPGGPELRDRLPMLGSQLFFRPLMGQHVLPRSRNVFGCIVVLIPQLLHQSLSLLIFRRSFGGNQVVPGELQLQ